MMRIRFTDLDMALTEEEQRQLDAAEKTPIAFDEDCSEMTAEKLRQFRHMDSSEHTKQTAEHSHP